MAAISKNFICFALALICSQVTMAVGYNCLKDSAGVVEELLRLEMSGLRLSSKSVCLDQKKFKWVEVFHEPSSEDSGAPEIDVKLPEGAKVRVIEVSKPNEIGEVVVKFLVEVEKRTYQDQMRIVIHSSVQKQKKSGCAEILSFPEKRFVWESCLEAK